MLMNVSSPRLLIFSTCILLSFLSGKVGSLQTPVSWLYFFDFDMCAMNTLRYVVLTLCQTLCQTVVSLTVHARPRAIQYHSLSVLDNGYYDTIGSIYVRPWLYGTIGYLCQIIDHGYLVPLVLYHGNTSLALMLNHGYMVPLALYARPWLLLAVYASRPVLYSAVCY